MTSSGLVAVEAEAEGEDGDGEEVCRSRDHQNRWAYVKHIPDHQGDATSWMRLRSINTMRRDRWMSDGSADSATNGATGGPGLPGRVSAEGQERDRRIDALAGDMIVAIGERVAAQRRAGDCCRS